ncbi:MAG: HAD hydrolase-like protein [bacterium]
MPIKNIIFDWSGTLVNDFPRVLEATNEIFKEYNKPPFTEDEFREKFFLPFPEFYKKHLPEATMIELDHYYHSAFKLLQDDIHPLPHAVEILEHCRAEKMPTFLLSSIHPEHFEVQSKRLGLKDYFTRAYVQAIDKRHVILKLLAEHDLEPRETLFVGDMQHDIETARHGGVKSCAVLTGYDSLEKLKKAQPDLLFRDLFGLLQYLKRHTTEPPYHPVVAVGALIHDKQGRVLMVRAHKWSNRWGIPGGKIKTNETALDAVHREIREETSLDLHSVRFVAMEDCIQPEEFYRPAHFVLLNYTAQSASTDVTLNEEADEFRWVAIKEALALPLNQPTLRLIRAIYPSL